MTGNVMFHEFIKKSGEQEDAKQELSDDEDKEDIKIEETEMKIEEADIKTVETDTKIRKDKKIRKKKRTA